MTIDELLRQARTALNSDSSIDVEVLLAHALSVTRTYLFTWGDRTVEPVLVDQFHALVERRMKGEPIAYITGHREFWSLDFVVNQHTLIPRHETECLVRFILDYFPASTTQKICDVGTGSGAIALAIAHERPHWQVVASDISQHALAIARHNAQRLACHNVTFVQSDLGNDISDRDFSAVVSNPPYIAEDDPHLRQADLVFEPQVALVAKHNGLACYEQLAQQAVSMLREDGLLVVEHGYQQGDDVRRIFQQARWKNPETFLDDQGQQRMTIAHRPD